jgi:hypothetical protein
MKKKRITSKELVGISINKISQEQVVEIIEGINRDERYWHTKEERRIRPVPNLSGRAPGSAGSEMVRCDQISDKKLDELFIQFIIEAVRKFDNLIPDIANGEFGFSPVFGILFVKEQENKFQQRYLIKFKKENLDRKSFIKFKRILYSKKSKEKRTLFSLEPINSIESYEY